MKFLGIDTNIIGNNDAVYYILKNIKELEKNFKLYLSPEYREKFYFVIALNHDILKLNFDMDKKYDNNIAMMVECSNNLYSSGLFSNNYKKKNERTGYYR